MSKPALGTATLANAVKAMALFNWLCRLDDCTLTNEIQESLKTLGFEVDHSATSRRHLYAKELPNAGASARDLVTILISQVDASTQEYQVEVMSSEPMARSASRCRQRAEELSTLIPPIGGPGILATVEA